jgi:hypothetical protein
MNKDIRHIHTMEYYSAIKGNELLIQATTQVALEDIILRKMQKTSKADIFCVKFV